MTIHYIWTESFDYCNIVSLSRFYYLIIYNMPAKEMIEKKQMFKREEVCNIIEDILMTWYNLQTEFEKWLNGSWLNNNNWANEHLRYEWLEEFINNLFD